MTILDMLYSKFWIQKANFLLLIQNFEYDGSRSSLWIPQFFICFSFKDLKQLFSKGNILLIGFAKQQKYNGHVLSIIHLFVEINGICTVWHSQTKIDLIVFLYVTHIYTYIL